MSAPAFGLYSARACTPAQRVSAGANLDLLTPVLADGVTLFRRSLWLPIPAAARQARALELAGSSLALRFAAADFQVETGNEAWFTRVETHDNQSVRLEFAWPAAVRRIHAPAGFGAIGMALHRADGEQEAEEPSQRGHTGAALSPAWIGSPLVIKLDHPIVPRLKKGLKSGVTDNIRARAGGGGNSPGSASGQAGQALSQMEAMLARVNESDIIPRLTLAGTPGSPRLKLVLETPGEERLLWQSLQAGEQAAVILPAGAVAEEWQAALEQVGKALASLPAEATPMLRLEVESDAPCAVSLQQATLALLARFDLAASPERLDFDGSQARTTPLDLGPLPAGTPHGLTLRGRLEGGDTAAPAVTDGEDGQRRGILLAADQAVVVKAELPAAVPLAGLGWRWHPLSDAIKGRVAVLADSGAGSGRELVKLAFSLPTPAPGWLALRWPALDLQPQALWLRLAVEEGMGLWLAAEGPPIPAGWQESYAPAGGTAPLALAPALQWLTEGNPALLQAGALRFEFGSLALQAERDGARLSLSLPATALPQLGTTPLAVSAATPARLTLEAVEFSALI